jgi:very-short-patch-repair endonuclease
MAKTNRLADTKAAKKWRFTQYVTKERSIADIARELGTYPNAVRRALIKDETELRSKSAAQALALKSGRAQHPTEGTERPPETRKLISEGVAQDWAESDEEKLRLRSDAAKRQWDAMSREEQEALRAAAAEGIRRTSKEGSRLEKSLLRDLTKAGMKVYFHRDDIIPHPRLQLDLFLPELKTVIEIDGPSHFLPIWGEDKLQRNIKADLTKSGLVLFHGMCMIRIKHLHKNVSAKLERDVFEAVTKTLNKIRVKFPVKTKRLIEIEV